MLNKRKLGTYGEELSAEFLIRNGYIVKVLNYRCMYGEIDIIAEKNGDLIFVEVKLRKSTEYGMPKEAVTKKKQRIISNVANFYISENNIDCNARFDVIEIVMILGEPLINHITDAFWDE